MEESLVLKDAIQVLGRTPLVLRVLLADLSKGWMTSNEGPETWNALEIVGHLIHGEKTDWIPRTRRILESGSRVPFDPFDRFAQSRESKDESLLALLEEFDWLRMESLEELAGFALEEADLDREGQHPEFGRVTLRQLLSTWVTHDLSHLARVARVMAKRHREAVGPLKKYLSILNR